MAGDLIVWTITGMKSMIWVDGMGLGRNLTGSWQTVVTW